MRKKETHFLKATVSWHLCVVELSLFPNSQNSKQQRFLELSIQQQPEPILLPPPLILAPVQKGEGMTRRARKRKEGSMGLDV